MPRIRYPAGGASSHQGWRTAGHPGVHLYSRPCAPRGWNAFRQISSAFPGWARPGLRLHL